VLRIAIVGCGKIADDHVSQIKQIAGSEVVGVCDREPLMARQLSQRFAIKEFYSDLNQMLQQARPDVVHVTTPPQTHYEIARTCLEAGCHVYVEKPFAVYAHQVRELVGLAQQKGLKVTAGHDYQFLHGARRMRALVKEGYLGGPAVHMESYFCYEMGGSPYSSALLGDKKHWVRALPGKLLHNIISHGIARIAEHLNTESPQVIASGFISPFLRSAGEEEIIDELRVMISEEGRTTAYFTFSSQMRPALHQFRIYGPKNGLILDQDNETLIQLRGGRYTSYAEKFIPPVTMAKQYLGNLAANVRKFAASDFHMKLGMKYLIDSFYRSIVEDLPAPIPYREIVRTAVIMDAIFEQIYAGASERGKSIAVGGNTRDDFRQQGRSATETAEPAVVQAQASK
jgi:predicted dehydrogenase